MAKKKKKSKIVRYRRPLNINVGMIIFAIIFLYLMFSVYTYLKRDKIQFYEVPEGGIVNTKSYTGLILREEKVMNTDRSGYINYYLPEGKRASVGTRIYSLDETGNLKELLSDQEQEGGQTLSADSLADLKRQLSSFVLGFHDETFDAIYDARYSLEASVMEYSSFSALDQLDQLAQQAGVTFEQVRSDTAGVVSYYFDSYTSDAGTVSYDSMTAADVEAASFEPALYSKTLRRSGDLVDSGTPACKVVSSENWSILFPLQEGDDALYGDKSSLKIQLQNASFTCSGAYSTITGKDGASYGKLDFNKYMETFLSDRFVTFEVEIDQASGLKIPASAVTEKEFLVVPLEFMGQGGDSSGGGFLKESYDPTNGQQSVEFVPETIYYSDDQYYYISPNEEGGLKAGDYIVKENSSDRFQLGQTATLKGVYNINKGYTVFKQIDILDSNGEYDTVAKGTSYGISVYDHIVLDASLVTEGQLLYQ